MKGKIGHLSVSRIQTANEILFQSGVGEKVLQINIGLRKPASAKVLPDVSADIDFPLFCTRSKTGFEALSTALRDSLLGDVYLIHKWSPCYCRILN